MKGELVTTGESLERDVANYYRKIGASKVEQNKLLGGSQIDIYVESEIAGQLQHRVAVEVKDWSNPVGIGAVNKFATTINLLINERIIHEGVIVSSSGFSRQARIAADTYGIKVYEAASLQILASGELGKEAGLRSAFARRNPKRARRSIKERYNLNRIRSGERETWEQLYCDLQRTLHLFILERVFDIQEAKELVQETFFRAYQSRQKFEGKSSVATWLFSISIDLIRNHIRSRRRTRRAYQMLKDVKREDKFPPELYELIEKALASVHRGYRELLIRRVVLRQTVKQVMSGMGFSTRQDYGIVLYRAMRALKAEMKVLVL